MAERVGFEPTVRFPARSLSRRVLSTAQPPLRVCRILPELLEAGLKSGAYTRCAVVSAFHRNRGLRGAAIGARHGDLLPGNRRKVYMILRNKEGSYVEGETQRSGDDWGVKAVGSGAACGGCGAGAGGVEAHHLRVEGEVWGAGRERGAAAAAAHG